MTDPIKSPVLRFLVYGHAWLAIGVAAQILWVGGLFLAAADFRIALLGSFVLIMAYGLLRLFRMSDPALDGSALIGWYRANTERMIAVVAICAIISIVLAWPLRLAILDALWKPGVAVGLYMLPSVLTGGRSKGLRNIPLLKAFLIAYGWASITTVLPAVMGGQDGVGVGDGLWWMFAVQFCFFLSMAIAFDIRDLPYDEPRLRTIPQVLGVRGAKFIAVLLLLPLCFLLILMSWMELGPMGSGPGGSPIDLAYAFPLLGVIALGVVIVFADTERPWWYYPILMDGMLLFIPLLAWLGGAV